MTRRRVTRQRATGFTLIEVMVVVAILGILAGLAIGFSGEWRRRQDFKKLTREVFNSLNLARSEAIKRGQRTYVHFDDTNSQIVVFLDGNSPSGDRAYDSGDDTLIYVFPDPGQTGVFADTYDADMTITAAAFAAVHTAHTVVFNHQGFCINDTNGDPLSGSISLGDSRLDNNNTNTVDITIAGAIRIQ